jgi:hypothetical protein
MAGEPGWRRKLLVGASRKRGSAGSGLLPPWLLLVFQSLKLYEFRFEYEVAPLKRDSLGVVPILMRRGILIITGHYGGDQPAATTVDFAPSPAYVLP